MFSVVPMSLCPNLSETTFIFSPFNINSVACVCLKPWNDICFSYIYSPGVILLMASASSIVFLYFDIVFVKFIDKLRGLHISPSRLLKPVSMSRKIGKYKYWSFIVLRKKSISSLFHAYTVVLFMGCLSISVGTSYINLLFLACLKRYL